MPNGVDEGVISYAIYEDEKMFYGVAEVDLPDFENMVCSKGIYMERLNRWKKYIPELCVSYRSLL